jgi:hypothetical protein
MLSTVDADRLSRPRLRRLDVAGEDPSPCAALPSACWSHTGVPKAAIGPGPEPPQCRVRRARANAGRAQALALAVAWAAFQRRPRARGPWREAGPTSPWAACAAQDGPCQHCASRP